MVALVAVSAVELVAACAFAWTAASAVVWDDMSDINDPVYWTEISCCAVKAVYMVN